MGESVDQFTSAELADEVDQENIHSTISALLEGSLGDKEESETSPVAGCGKTVVPESNCEEKSSATLETNQEEGIDAVLLSSEDGLEKVSATEPEIAKVTAAHNTETECKEAAVEPSWQMQSVDAPHVEDAGDSPTDSGQSSEDKSKHTDTQIPNAKCDDSVHLTPSEEFKEPSDLRSEENLMTSTRKSCTDISIDATGPVLNQKSSKSDNIASGDVQECSSSVDPPQKLTESDDNHEAPNEHCHSINQVEEKGFVEAGTDAKVSEALKQLSEEKNFAPKKQKRNPSKKYTAEITDNSSHSPSAANVQKTVKKVPAKKKEDITEPSIEDWNNIEAQENLNKDNTVPLKKHLRAPSKSVKYTEVNSSPEKAAEDDDRVATVPHVKKKLGRPPGSSKIRSSTVVKPVEREPLPPSSEALVKNGNCVIVKENSGKIKAIRLPKQKVNDNAEISLFVPEGWIFFASKRETSVKESFYDLYYVTPPPRVKLRSRIELVKYMAANGLDYDPTKFFIRRSIEPLVKRGILINYKEKYLVQSSDDEAVLQEIIKPWLHSSKLKAKQLQSMKTKPNQLVRKALKRSANSRAPTAQKIRKISLDKSQNEGLSHESGEEDSNDHQKTGVGLVGEESNHSRKPLRGRPPKKQISSPSKTPDTDTPPDANETSPSRKSTRGRTRRSVAAPEILPPLQPSAIEERGRLRVRPPKKSPYFPPKSNDPEKPKNVLALRREKNDPPPRSPYNLIQEDLFHDPWQLLIATIFLNSTSGRVAIPLTLEFLKRWPTPELARQAKVDDILDVIEPLGFGRTRAAIILRFSHEYLTKEWKLPSELYGIGEYGNDSYKIFCLKNAWKSVQSDDPMLMMYLNWRRATEHLRKRFLNASSSSKTIDPDDLYPSIASSAQPINGAEASQKSIQSRPPPRKKRRGRTSTK